MKHLGSAVHLGDYKPGTDTWTHLRRRRVGGSEIAAVLGLSPWESRFSLWHRKRGTIGPVDETDLMWWGTHIEPVVAQRFALQHPEFDVRRCGTYRNVERDHQLISPDRVLFTRGSTRRWELLEIKNAHHGEEWGDDGTEDIPIHYRCQVMWAMDAFGKESHRLAAYFGGDRYREYVVPYDETDALILRKRAEDFLESVEKGDMPEIDGHPATYGAVRAMHPDIEDVDVALPAELAEPYLAAIVAEKTNSIEKARTAAEVAQYMGSARRATYGTKATGTPRSIATRIPGRGDKPPYLRANPLPPTAKEIT